MKLVHIWLVYMGWIHAIYTLCSHIANVKFVLNLSMARSYIYIRPACNQRLRFIAINMKIRNTHRDKSCIYVGFCFKHRNDDDSGDQVHVHRAQMCLRKLALTETRLIAVICLYTRTVVGVGEAQPDAHGNHTNCRYCASAHWSYYGVWMFSGINFHLAVCAQGIFTHTHTRHMWSCVSYNI